MIDYNLYFKNNIKPLTKRELEVLEHVAAGKTNNEIANVLDVTRYTIKAHVSSILYKMNVENRLNAVLKAVEIGIVQTNRFIC